MVEMTPKQSKYKLIRGTMIDLVCEKLLDFPSDVAELGLHYIALTAKE